MEDAHIVDLFWKRSENAIAETSAKYGKYCFSIAFSILADEEDAKECVNDAYLDAWNCIPPHRPAVLSTFLGKITRRIAIDRWRSRTADKRGGGELNIVFEELSDSLPTSESIEHTLESAELGRKIDAFVMALPLTERRIFIRRYWYLDSISAIGQRFNYSSGRIKVILYRTRKKLREYLESEGLLS